MLRLGRVSFINTFPVEWALSRHLDPGEVREVAAVPTALNRMLAARELDVANVSSIEYAHNPERYVLLPSLCVGSDGAVESVQLVTPLPLPAVRTIAATRDSATSVVLARVLVPHAEILDQDEPADAKLLIGDAALSSAFSDPTPHHDLGALWRERTGLPMVFAVWAAQRDCDPDALGRIDRALRAAVAEASEHADLVARAAGEIHGFPAGYLARYFEKLRYGFGERERAGLSRFYELAAERGAITASPPELRFAESARVR
jgi:chorismate dehydratase